MHRFHGRRAGGFVMTYTTLAGIVKYPHTAGMAGKKGKFGFFHSEKADYLKIAHTLGIAQKNSDETGNFSFSRHPLVYLVEAADDICYEIMDIEDAHKLKILSYDETETLFLGFFDPEQQQRIRHRLEEDGVTDPNERIVYLRASVIGKLENECVTAFVNNEERLLNGTLEGSLIQHIAPLQRQAYQHCTEVSKARIYRSKPVLDVELSGYKIMETLMEALVNAAVNPERYYSQQLIRRFSNQYHIQSNDLETRLMAVIDYISGMTDVYALDIYQKINGISLPII